MFQNVSFSRQSLSATYDPIYAVWAPMDTEHLVKPSVATPSLARQRRVAASKLLLRYAARTRRKATDDVGTGVLNTLSNTPSSLLRNRSRTLNLLASRP